VAGVLRDELLHRRQGAQAARDEHDDREQYDGTDRDDDEPFP